MINEQLTSISPLITHGKEFKGVINVLNRATQVKTYKYVSKGGSVYSSINNLTKYREWKCQNITELP